MKTRNVFVLWMAVMLLMACQPLRDDLAPMPPEPAISQPLDTLQPDVPHSDTMDDNMTKLPESMPSVDPLPPVTGEAPAELMDSILKDLFTRTGIAPEQVTVTRAQAVVWNDGSLGCPQPGMFYTQALVRGYWVVLEWGGKMYDYHAAESGHFILCEGGQPPFAAPGLPDK